MKPMALPPCGLYKNGKIRLEAGNIHESVAQQFALPSPMRDHVHTPYFRGLTLQQVLAMLVDGVYSRDREGVDFILVVKPFLEKEYRVDERMEHYTRLHWTHMTQWSHAEEEKARRVGLKHYLRKENHPNPVAPRLVIAFRGTKLSSVQDINDDIKIAGDALHSSTRFKTCQELAESLITKFRDHHDGRPEEIYITGHSLGAAIALLIAKKLAAEKNERYAVYCFNPPFLTLVQLIQRGLLCEKLIDLFSKSHLLGPILNFTSCVSQLASKKILSTFFGIHTEELQEKIVHFARLVDWVPVLYINEHDDICNGYLRYYKDRPAKISSVNLASPAMVSRLVGRHAKYALMTPSARICVSTRLKCPHELRQWYKEPDLQLLQCDYWLLGRQPLTWAYDSTRRKMLCIRDGRVHDGDNVHQDVIKVTAVQIETETETEAVAANNYVAAAPSMGVPAMASTGGQFPRHYDNLGFLQECAINPLQCPEQPINVQQYQQQRINQQFPLHYNNQAHYPQQYPPHFGDQQYHVETTVQATSVQVGKMNLSETTVQATSVQVGNMNLSETTVQATSVQVGNMNSAEITARVNYAAPFASMGVPATAMSGQCPQQCYPPQQYRGMNLSGMQFGANYAAAPPVYIGAQYPQPCYPPQHPDQQCGYFQQPAPAP